VGGESKSEPTWPGIGYIRSLLTPVVTFAFVLYRPDDWWSLAAFVLFPFVVDAATAFSGEETRQPNLKKPSLFLRSLPYMLFALHWANLILACQLVHDFGFFTPTSILAGFLLVLSAALAGGANGHELIHRKPKHQRFMGRLLLSSMLYEHFVVEHVRGHHVYASTDRDVTTARFGESFFDYLLRVVPGQVVSALRFEDERTRKHGFFGRTLGNRVYQGFLIEALLVVVFFAAFGVDGGALFLIQAAWAHMLYQAVLYMEHWGLAVAPDPPLAWDTTNRSTLMAMLGIARHADHHAAPRRPYYLLRHIEETPKLPTGYAGMLWLVLLRNAKFREVMTAELDAQVLGVNAPEPASGERADASVT